MNNQWMLYAASIVTGISFSLLYVAINHDIPRPVVNVMRTIQLKVVNNWNSSNSYGEALNALSQKVFSNKTYEDTIE